MFNARARRRLSRGFTRKHRSLLHRLKEAKKNAPELLKPECVKTHLRDMIVLPEMVGCVVGIHNGKTFNQVFLYFTNLLNYKMLHSIRN